MNKKLYIFCLFIMLLVIPLVNGLSITGNCSLEDTCTVTAQNYTATLRGCAIKTIVFNYSTTQWTSNDPATSTQGIGQIYTTGGILRTDMNNTLATVTQGGNYIKINCTGASAHIPKNTWYFFDEYINLTQVAEAYTYYSANYFNESNAWIINKTNNISGVSTLTNYNTNNGIVGITFPSYDNYTLAFAFTNGITNSSGLRTSSAGPPTINIGRGQTIPANTSINILIKMVAKNESAPNQTQGYIDAIMNFRNNLPYVEPLENVTISSLTVTSINNTAVRISWTTNTATNVTLRYGTTTALGTNITNTTFSTSHSQTITGLTQGTTYYYNVTGYNSTSMYSTSGGNTFTTTQSAYYYNATGGNDSLNCETPTNACKTIVDLNTKTLIAGDTVYFAKGEVWRLPNDSYPTFDSGSTSGNVTYTSYGTGARPRFLGSYNFSSNSSWTNTATNIWRSTWTIHDYTGYPILNGEITTPVEDTYAELNTQGDLWYNTTSKYIYMYSTSNPGNYYTSIEIPLKEQMFDLSSKHDIVINDLDIRYGGSHGLQGAEGYRLYIINNTFYYIGGAFQTYPTRYGNCIEFYGNSHDTEIKYNNISQCYDAAITHQRSSTGAANIYNHKVEYNIISYSRYIYEFFNANTSSTNWNISITHNTGYKNGKGFSKMDHEVTNNTGYIRLSRDTTNSGNWTIKDNLWYDSSTWILELTSTLGNWKGQAPYLDYNLYYNDETEPYTISWNTTPYADLSSFRTAINKEIYGKELNPLLATGTLVPADNSPACNMSSTGGYVGALPCAPPSGDNITPSLIINTASYTNKTIYTTNNITFNWTASDLTLANITIYINEIVNYTNTSPANGTAMTKTFTLPNGNYTWYIVAKDSSGNYNRSELTNWVEVSYDGVTAPTITAQSPLNTTDSFRPTEYTCNTYDNVPISNVLLFINGTLYNNYTTTLKNLTVTWTVSQVNGNYSWYCRTVNAWNNQSNSSTYWVLVDAVVDEEGHSENCRNTPSTGMMVAIMVAALALIVVLTTMKAKNDNSTRQKMESVKTGLVILVVVELFMFALTVIINSVC